MAWNAIAEVGNPMRLIEVNELIKTVKKQEVQNQGKSSTAQQDIPHPNLFACWTTFGFKDDREFQL